MAASKQYNGVRFTTSTTGTGDITVGAAVPGHLTPAQAGVQNGDVCTWAIEGIGTFEVFQGAYSSTGPTITRAATPYRSTGTGNNTKISLVGGEHVSLVAAAEDYDLSRMPGIVGADHGGGLIQPSARIVLASGDPYATFEINAAYDTYEWAVTNCTPTTNEQNLRLVVATGTFPSSLVFRASNYAWAQHGSSLSTGTFENHNPNDSSIVLSNAAVGVENAANVGISGILRLQRQPGGGAYSFFNGQFFNCSAYVGTNYYLTNVGGFYAGSIDLKAVSFFFGVPGINTFSGGRIDMRAWNLSQGP